MFLKEILMKNRLVLATGNTDFNLGFETFLTIGKTLDKHAPLKKTSTKDEKKQQKIELSDKVNKTFRDKLQKQFIKSKKNKINKIKQAP